MSSNNQLFLGQKLVVFTSLANIEVQTFKRMFSHVKLIVALIFFPVTHFDALQDFSEGGDLDAVSKVVLLVRRI